MHLKSYAGSPGSWVGLNSTRVPQSKITIRYTVDCSINTDMPLQSSVTRPEIALA